MTDIQNPPVDISALSIERKSEKDALIGQLDSLLERYLHTLDKYEKVGRELSKQLSSGYMSLAQANFHNSSSAIKYGQDCYDERMQAIRKINISEDGKTSRPHFSVQSDKAARQGVKTTDADTPMHQTEADGKASQSKNTELPSQPIKAEEPLETNSAADENQTQDPNDSEEPTKSSEKSNDPLRWFGILVPPALRTAQATFVGAVEGPIPQLATIARDLRMQEIEVRRVRRAIKKL
ncbi:hypothetical protein EJ02DRAFT_430056 [Clathrospora elynae]|uniref:Vacuolar ATPase assembly protein VMA22 n=1 Tax=Clathrospora elynae TaxID=706981 RepID=A0A6A5T4X8_9PLEO|nr:hypothetical protein EJ02DRAFT_430056 [Clathrospora elynae]